MKTFWVNERKCSRFDSNSTLSGSTLPPCLYSPIDAQWSPMPPNLRPASIEWSTNKNRPIKLQLFPPKTNSQGTIAAILPRRTNSTIPEIPAIPFYCGIVFRCADAANSEVRIPQRSNPLPFPRFLLVPARTEFFLHVIRIEFLNVATFPRFLGDWRCCSCTKARVWCGKRPRYCSSTKSNCAETWFRARFAPRDAAASRLSSIARAAAREWLRLQWARRHRPDRSLQRDREPAIAIPCRTYRCNRRSILCNRCPASADSASNPPGVSAGRLWKDRVWRVARGFERSPWREEWGNGEIRVRVCGGLSKERLIRTPFPRKRGASGNRRRSRSWRLREAEWWLVDWSEYTLEAEPEWGKKDESNVVDER